MIAFWGSRTRREKETSIGDRESFRAASEVSVRVWCPLGACWQGCVDQIRVGNGTLATVQWEEGARLRFGEPKSNERCRCSGQRARGVAEETRGLVVVRFVGRAVVASTVCSVRRGSSGGLLKWAGGCQGGQGRLEALMMSTCTS